MINFFEKILEIEENLGVRIIRIKVTKKQLEQFKESLKKLEIRDKTWKGVQPIDMLVLSKKDLYIYGSVEIEVR